MKKKFLFLGLSCFSFLLTGCGGNKFTCECETVDEDEGKTIRNYVFHYDKEWKKVESIDYELGYEVYNGADVDIDELEKELEEMCEEDDAPSDCKVKTNGNKTTLFASASPDDFGLDEDMTKDEIRDELNFSKCSCK